MSKRKKAKREPGQQPAGKPSVPASGSNPAADGDIATGGRRALSRRRKWLFRLVAVSMPLLLLGLELGLWLFGYGVETSFVLQRTVGDETRIVNNPTFTWQFFGPNLAREGSPFSLTPTKPAGTCRIFLLGGSAAMGFPEPAFGMARALEVMLRNRYPGVSFEYAELLFRLARCHWQLGKFDDARALYEKARDLDTLRFRADTRINALIRQVAVERAAAGVTLADAEKAVRENSPHGVPGNEAIYEHVHLRFRGTYLVARALCGWKKISCPF